MVHSGKFMVDMKIEESILDYEILNLLIQPLVENAIVHGLNNKDIEGDKKIEVRGECKNGKIIFEVVDNGSGMSETMLENIFSVESEGYGVKNVQHRIKLYYGDEYGLNYESKVNEGTRVVLTIPSMKISEKE